MDYRLEVVTVPVSDADRARDFYAEKLGFDVGTDVTVGDGVRLVELTPPGSPVSIHLGTTTNMDPGVLEGLILVVTDVREARAELVERGVEVGEFRVLDGGAFRPALEGENLDHVGSVLLDDPDGNGWSIQQVPAGG